MRTACIASHGHRRARFEKAGGIFVISRMPEIVREYTVAETLFILEDVNYLSRMVSKKTMDGFIDRRSRFAIIN